MREQAGQCGEQFLIRLFAVARIDGVQVVADFFPAENRPEKRSRHAVSVGRRAWPIEIFVPGNLCCPKCSPGITGCRLDPDGFKGSFTFDAAVGDAIKRHSTGQAEVLLAGFFMQSPGEPEDHFFGYFLDGGGNIHFTIRQRALRFARRTIK